MTFLAEKLRYEPSEGKFYWLDSGEEAGYNKMGYRYLMVDGTEYAVHHLVWFYEKGEWPEDKDVDHINMNRSDNLICNLRLASRSQNMLNTKAHKDSSTGVKGIVKRENGKYSVRITVNGKYKCFGCYDSLEFAELVAEEARARYHGEYARS